MNNKNIPIDYLRAFITMLVVAHHSFIGYAKFVPSPNTVFGAQPYLWSVFPVVDSQRWSGFDLLILFNDTFFMSLMFLLAGLFVFPGIVRKGHQGYLRGRFLRLGLPFVVAVIFLAPLAYYPSYLLSGSNPGLMPFLQEWASLAYWPPGPVWFIAVLLALDGLAVLFHKFVPRTLDSLAAFSSGAAERPFMFFLAFAGVSILVYLPMLLEFGPLRWFKLGPFVIQSSRVLLYPTFFFTGVAIGAWGLERGLLAKNGELARRWMKWLGIAVVAFALFGFFFAQTRIQGAASPVSLRALTGAAFALTCVSTSFLLLATFVRFANQRSGLLDSLSANAYGIFLVHYAIVSWLQYALLASTLSGFQKGVTVFSGALLLSWGVVACLRRHPFLDRILSSGARPTQMNNGGLK